MDLRTQIRKIWYYIYTDPNEYDFQTTDDVDHLILPKKAIPKLDISENKSCPEIMINDEKEVLK